MPTIITNKICKSYGDVQALTDVTLQVNEGELFGLIGPDGAGKSTLLRILCTLLVPDSGTAEVEGYDVVKDYRAIRSHVGYMPGHFALYQDLTVEENINFFASIFGVPRKEGYELIKPIYEQIEPFKNRQAGKLSGGMKQKLALCCALIHRPKVLILDEPTTGVDAVSRQEFWDLLTGLKKQGITIMVSTPYMDEAMRCERIALINAGKIMEVDTPHALIERYHQPSIEDVFIYLMGGSDMHFDFSQHIHPEDKKAINVKDLTKKFGNFTAVDHITFSVEKGEIFGFLGANGAGKTTAIRMLCGLSYPTSGSGTVAGYDITCQAEEIKRHIGYMSQRFSLYDDLTVWENMQFFGGLYGMTREQITERGTQLLKDLNFYDRRTDLVTDIPLGWKQKLAFTVALLHKPEIVFLDEPTGGVDPIVRRQFWELIYETATKGVTIFVTTHYMDEAEYCNRISIMVAGKIKALNTPENLKKEFHAESMDEVFRILARGGGAEKP
ncbi:MAG: ATP-binding cassette domain-containing protein [Bacteroidales bacterium]|nr:ATP-binding cassette domain-containing protein [Bacteroidales bacterium]